MLSFHSRCSRETCTFEDVTSIFGHSLIGTDSEITKTKQLNSFSDKLVYGGRNDGQWGRGLELDVLRVGRKINQFSDVG